MEYIDLELPSGTLWASENEEGYYTFDRAVEQFGNQLPTRAQFCELVDYTTHKWDKERKGMRFIGKNSNELFFPASGYRDSGDCSLDNVGNLGLYWSCTPTGYLAYFLRFYSNGNVSPSGYGCRANGQSIRLVKDNFMK